MGLRDLARDDALVEALKMSEAEWQSLLSLAFEPPTDRDGYVQLLFTLRAIRRI